MKQKIGLILGVIAAAAVLVAATIFIATSSPATPTGTVEFLDKEDIESLASQIDFSGYDTSSVIPADANTGYLPEKVKGDPETARVVIYEFADYACSHCAETNTELNRLYREYEGQIAIVFRNYILGFQNSVPTAVAANAADLQGYWETFKNLIFTEQAAWNRLQGSRLQDYLVKAFETASNGAGDTNQFIEDMWSLATTQRIAFDQAAANSLSISSTPYILINGQHIANSELRATVEALLKK